MKIEIDFLKSKMKFLIIFLALSFNTQLFYGQTTIKLINKNGIFVIPCKVNGISLDFYFDTGASDVSLSLSEASELYKKGLLLPTDIIGKAYYQTASGNIEEGITVLLKLLEIGDIKIYNVKASIRKSLKAPLLLGQSALSKLGKFSFDYSNNSLTILGQKKFDFLKQSILNQNVKKNFYIYKNKNLSDDGNVGKWISLKSSSIYKKPYSDTIIGTLKSNEKFYATSSEYHFYKLAIARISGIDKNDFEDCKPNNFKIGDLIYILNSEGEGVWNVIHNNVETYINCTIDEVNMKLTERAYEGCNNILAKIIDRKEEYIFWVKVKTQKGTVGWIRNPQCKDFKGLRPNCYGTASPAW